MSEKTKITWTAIIQTGWRSEVRDALSKHSKYGESWDAAVVQGGLSDDDDDDDIGSDWRFRIILHDMTELEELLACLLGTIPRHHYVIDLYATAEDDEHGVRSEAMLHDPAGVWGRKHGTFAGITCTDRDDTRRKAMKAAVDILRRAM
jgi:hypothetical protein